MLNVLLSGVAAKMRCDECKNWKPKFDYPAPNEVLLRTSECSKGVKQHDRGVDAAFCCALIEPCF
jgi:hypothetical protein